MVFYIPNHYGADCYQLKHFIDDFPVRNIFVGEDGKLINIDFQTLELIEFRGGRIEHGNDVLDKHLMRYDNDWMEFLFRDKDGYILARWAGKDGIKGILRPADEEAKEFIAGRGMTVIGKQP